MLSPAGVLLPSLPWLSLLLQVRRFLGAWLCPCSATKPSFPAVDGRERTNGLTPREGRRGERRVASGVMSLARRALPRIVRPRGSQSLELEAVRGPGGCVFPEMAPRAPVTGLRTRPGPIPAARGGDERGGAGAKERVRIRRLIEPVPSAGGEPEFAGHEA